MAGEEATQVETQPDVVVTVEAEAQASDVVVQQQAEVKDPAINDLVEQYKALEETSKANEEARRAADAARLQAQYEADQAKREAAAAKAAATSSNLDTITTSLTAAQEAAEA